MSDPPRPSHSRRDKDTPAPIIRVDGYAWQEISGSVHAMKPTEVDPSGLPVSNRRSAQLVAPMIAQVDNGSQWPFSWTIAWVQSFGSRLWGQNVTVTSEDDVTTGVDHISEGAPTHVASVGDIHSSLEDDPSSGGSRIGETVGNYSDIPIASGATSVQAFHDIGTNVLAHLRETPAHKTLPPDLVPRRGETIVGRVIGNVNTGSVGPNGTSKQIFGWPQYASSGARQGYTVFKPQRSSASTSTFTVSGQGETLGGAPAGDEPRNIRR